MASPKHKASLCFISPLNSMTDKVEIKAAFADLKKQVLEFAESITTDANIMVSHTVISDDPKDMVPVGRNVVDPHMAGLQTINKRIEDGKSVAVKPGHKSKFEVPVTQKDEEEEVPHVRAVTNWTPTVDTTPVVLAATTITAPVTNVTTGNNELKTKFETAIFDNIRRTKKSMAIIGYFLNNLDKDVSIKDIADGAKLENVDVSIWFTKTGKSIKAIGPTDKRGIYRFDSSKMKVK